MMILQLDDETYAALNHVIDYVLEHEADDYNENENPNHVYACADLVANAIDANAIDAQADEQPGDVPVRDDDYEGEGF